MAPLTGQRHSRTQARAVLIKESVRFLVHMACFYHCHNAFGTGGAYGFTSKQVMMHTLSVVARCAGISRISEIPGDEKIDAGDSVVEIEARFARLLNNFQCFAAETNSDAQILQQMIFNAELQI